MNYIRQKLYYNLDKILNTYGKFILLSVIVYLIGIPVIYLLDILVFIVLAFWVIGALIISFFYFLIFTSDNITDTIKKEV
jgi:hypothetical protein